MEGKEHSSGLEDTMSVMMFDLHPPSHSGARSSLCNGTALPVQIVLGDGNLGLSDTFMEPFILLHAVPVNQDSC